VTLLFAVGLRVRYFSGLRLGDDCLLRNDIIAIIRDGHVPPHREGLAGLLHADTVLYLPNDMLVKVDRMSMANGDRHHATL